MSCENCRKSKIMAEVNWEVSLQKQNELVRVQHEIVELKTRLESAIMMLKIAKRVAEEK